MNSKEKDEETNQREVNVMKEVFSIGANNMKDKLDNKLSAFIQHLIDTRVIDCASHEDIMQRWTDFQNS